MSAILNSFNAHNFLIFQPLLMKLVSKFIVYRTLSDKTFLLLISIDFSIYSLNIITTYGNSVIVGSMLRVTGSSIYTPCSRTQCPT